MSARADILLRVLAELMHCAAAPTSSAMQTYLRSSCVPVGELQITLNAMFFVEFLCFILMLHELIHPVIRIIFSFVRVFLAAPEKISDATALCSSVRAIHADVMTTDAISNRAMLCVELEAVVEFWQPLACDA